MNTDLVQLYKQLENIKQTDEILQVKNQIKEALYQKLKMHTLELTGIGRVIGYEELKVELTKALNLINIENQQRK